MQIEVYRDRDFTRVGLLQGLLESAGIPCMLRNANAVSMTTEVPIPDMFPNLCVFSREDAERALSIIREHESRVPTHEHLPWQCPNCGQLVEAQFGECWNCQHPAPD